MQTVSDKSMHTPYTFSNLLSITRQQNLSQFKINRTENSVLLALLNEKSLSDWVLLCTPDSRLFCVFTVTELLQKNNAASFEINL